MAWPGTIYLEQPYAIQSSEPTRSCSEKKKTVTRKIMKIKKNVKEREVSIILSGKFINILEIMQLPDICFVI